MQREGFSDEKVYHAITMMVLSHISALEYWLSVRIGSRSFVKVPQAPALISKPPSAEPTEGLGPWWLARPLHVLVARGSLRRRGALVCHVWKGALPKGSVLDTQNGFCVCSPEVCFLQMASILSLVELIQLGFELCGTYDLSSDDVRECPSLTSVSKLTACIEKIPNVNGRKKALRALRYIAENSASPMETSLVMLQCLPYRFGGYGMEMPLLNFRIDVTGQARRFTSRSYFKADLYWPAFKLIAEYDSDKYHKEARRKASDSERRNALEAMGYTVVSITLDLVDNRASMARVANVLAKHTGRRLTYVEPEFTVACIKLRSVLFSGERYGLNAERAHQRQ